MPSLKKKTYAGIGSRDTPKNVLKMMQEIATLFEVLGFTLRSGGAGGADSAFEAGVTNLKEIFTAEDATPESLDLASRTHPNWTACSPYAKRLHARNGMILLGKDLSEPVDFVVCWTPQGKIQGGTGQALRLAEARGIKVYNLFFKEHLQELRSLYKRLKV